MSNHRRVLAAVAGVALTTAAATVGPVACNAIDGLSDIPNVAVFDAASDTGHVHHDAGRDAVADTGKKMDGAGSHDGPHEAAHEAAATADASDANLCPFTCSGACCSTQCLDGACVVTLARDQSPVAIAVDATHVYWTNAASLGNAGSVNRVPIVGGSISTLFTPPGQGSPFALAVTPTRVFCSDSVSWGLYTFGLDGSNATTVVAPTGGGFGGYPSAIGFSGTTGFYITQGNEGNIWELDPADGGTYTQGDFPVSVSGSVNPPAFQPLAVDANNVYWVNGTAVAQLSIASPSGETIDLAPVNVVTMNPTFLALDLTHVYFTDGPGGLILRVPIGGGALVTIAANQYEATSIAVDATNVYWTTSPALAQGTVATAPKAPTGAAPITLQSGQEQPNAIAVDATSVYWTTIGSSADGGFNNTGFVMKLTPKVP